MPAFASVAHGIVLLASVAGCAHSEYQPLDYRSISAVEAEIKRQVGVYMTAERSLAPVIVDVDGKSVPLPTDTAAYACGAGHIRFDVMKVKADLLVTKEHQFGASGGVAPPVIPAALDLSAGYKRDRSETKELIYNVWFDPLDSQDLNQEFLRQTPTYQSLRDNPIAEALVNLRDSLIASGLKVDPYTHLPRGPLPCHWDWNHDPEKPGGDPEDSFKFAITVSNEFNGGANLKIYIVSLGVTDDVKSTTGNTVTVSFYEPNTLHVIADQATQKTAAAAHAPTRPALAAAFNPAEDLLRPIADVTAQRPPRAPRIASPSPTVKPCTPDDARFSCLGGAGAGHGQGMSRVPQDAPLRQ